MFTEKLSATDISGATVARGGPVAEVCGAVGVFNAELVRDGKVIWEDTFPNVVTTVGKNLALDTYLAGSAYTVTGPYMGLLGSSSTSSSTTAASDTMASHAGWLEQGGANAPTYSGTRKTAAWNSASGGSKSLSAALSFSMTSSGTVQGAFLLYGANAINTVDNSSGVLYSAGQFASGGRNVLSGDTLNVSYTASL